MLKIIHEEVLNCGYGRCCPTVKQFEDGSMELFDNDLTSGSVGTIKLHPEVVARLTEIAAQHKKP